MGASDRIVRHLRLRADNEASVRRAVLQLEDALRCASLPDVGARVLLVRRLNLGRLPSGASSQTLSLLLEQRVAAAGGSWVHGADPTAANADYVFFRDTFEAHSELSLKLANGISCDAWYWPLAVPVFKPAESAHANLRRIALAIADLPEAPAALPAWVASLTAAGTATVLASAIGPIEAAALLRAAGLSEQRIQQWSAQSAMSASSASASEVPDADEADVPPRRIASPHFTSLPIWVRTLALAGGFVPATVSVAVPVHAASESRAGESKQTETDSNHPNNIQDGASSEAAENNNGISNSNGLAAPVSREAEVAALSDAPKSFARESSGESSLSQWAWRDAAPSACGGLLFLLPVLQRLGYAAWAETLPDGVAIGVVQQMLAMVLRRLHVASDDPAWAFANDNQNDMFSAIVVDMPIIWRADELKAPRGVSQNAQDISDAASIPMLARMWLTLCRRWLRRVAGFGMASLVMRPATIQRSPTHADVFFKLRDTDMRVRCAGLDFDPGWLPWYGRVVTFHYCHEDSA